jgi:hypothetical protein
MQLLPFKPYPGFDWFVLGICIILTLMNPKAAIVGFIWFSFAVHYVCNRISVYLVNKPFVLPVRGTKLEELHLVGLLLLPFFFLGVFFSTYLLFNLGIYFNESFNW